ncbi:MAG: precorrin-6Y C5,15-methyltransferase (decarboxylating) subunit CbiT [Selenomonadaceae bacterium]|nr:precorrin-6Y C5,15-methyltransferase (decarboxylating) subunit CbiT [Selenomonadaceae bacterium]
MVSFGIFDDEFIRGNVPMTKREVRILTLNEGKINDNSIIYDIGAGTGSLSIEAALAAKNGKVYAIEKNIEGVNLIKQNCEKFNVKNIEIINKIAPDGTDNLPVADCIFIGGSGGNLTEILSVSQKKIKLSGRIIINAITIESLNTSFEFLRENKDFKYYSFEVFVSRYNHIGNYHLKKAENPISIIVCEKN